MLRPVAAIALAIAAPAPAAAQGTEAVQVEPVTFLSRDGKTQVKAYLFRPASAPARMPAVVMMHGRSGAYSSGAKGRYDATTLSARHKAWGQLLARSGYAALMVDDFGPVGHPTGFRAGTYADRPAVVDEVVNRPLHAYGALRFLQQRPDVDGARVALLGWSNGGSTALAAMANDKPGDMKRLGFKAGVALYPGCGMKRRFNKDGYVSYAPVRVFMGTADEEVSPKLCQDLVARSRGTGGDIAIRMFDGASHGYDSPTRSRQSVAANAEATAATRADVLAFLGDALKETAR